MNEKVIVKEIPGKWEIPYMYSIGATASQFFEALSARKILATHCPVCDQVFIPPRSFCEECFVPLDQWRELGNEGVIEAATIVSESFAGLPAPPFALAYVKLDGADTAIGNFLRGIDLSDVAAARAKMVIGTRVRVKFRDDPEGRITEFFYEP